jgi:hypothetical protein
MKLQVRKIVAVCLVLAVGICVILAWNNRHIGRALDSYRGVHVFDNGLLFFRSYGKNYARDGYYFGQKWQCVEFIKRFYYETKAHKMPDVMGHAKSFFDVSIPDGALNTRRGLLQYHNGSTDKPRPDDLIVFADTRYGHVGIVTEVGSDFIEIIQQNIVGHTRQRFSLSVSNGHFSVNAPRKPAGWLRYESQARATIPQSGQAAVADSSKTTVSPK